jgi:TonB family protein
MNCEDVAEILDERLLESLSERRRSALETHVGRCADCAAAWHAHRVLEAEPAARIPRALYASILGEETTRAGRRLAQRIATMIGLVALAGAVYAGLAMFYEREASRSADSTVAGPLDASVVAVDEGAARAVIEFVSAQEEQERRALGRSFLSQRVAPDGEMFALLKPPPVYPERAAVAGLEGYAIVEFTVTAEGSVSDATIIESSSPEFEAASLAAVERFKYKPRIVNGAAVAVSGVRNRIGFRWDRAAPGARGDRGQHDETRERAVSAAETGNVLDNSEWNARMQSAYDCLRVDDFQCIELELDELMATYRLSDAELSELWRIYGYVQHRRRNAERAIEAYTLAAELSAGSGDYWHALSLMTVARLYYDRHEYQPALDAAIAYLKVSPNPTIGDYVFVDRLRELGAAVR